ncbi:hypothetical protein FRC12_014903 [Ceratobasidium sp. 428]|nr:hypothetical protein FRC12_014903 [Ceratobasidium sp. 428]
MGLVHLKIAPAFKLFSHKKLHTLLSANLQLESLEVTTGLTEDDENFETVDLRAVLQYLGTLTLSWNVCLPWILGIMKMIGGPIIKHLQLNSVMMADELLQLARQIVDRSYRSDLPTSNNQEALPRQHVYPALRSLDIPEVRSYSGRNDMFRGLLAALPTVEVLTAPDAALTHLGEKPWLLPHLERIKVSGRPPVSLGAILRRRIRGCFPLKTLEIQEQYLTSVKGGLPKSLNVAKLPSPASISAYGSYGDVGSGPVVTGSRQYRGCYGWGNPYFQLVRMGHEFGYEYDDNDYGSYSSRYDGY